MVVSDKVAGGRAPLGVMEWQREAWGFYDECGEYREGVTWKANVCSRVRLTIVEDDGKGGTREVTEGPEREALDELGGTEVAMSQFLRTFAQHMEVPGETILVQEPVVDIVPPDEGRPVDVEPDPVLDSPPDAEWTLYSHEECTETSRGSGVWKVDRGDGVPRFLRDGSVVIRMWQPHPRRWVHADSPSRALLPILRQIRKLDQAIDATLDSRLAGAGVLAMPSELSFRGPGPTQPAGPDDEPPPPVEDPFYELFYQSIVVPLTNRQDASSVVPFVVEGPGEVIDKIKHIMLTSPLDKHVPTLRDTGFVRLARAMDAPAEVILGFGDTNHWSAWQIDEQGVKTYAGSLLELMTSALSTRWLPAVMGSDYNPGRWVGFDTTDLRARPDRTAQGFDLYDRGELSGKALRGEASFDESAAPDPAEQRRILLLRQARTTSDPIMFAAVMAALGYVFEAPEQPAAAPPALPAPAEPAPIEQPPVNRRELPEPEAARDRSLYVLAAASVMAARAIERAANKVNRRGARRGPIDGATHDDLLRDAWTMAPDVAQILNVDAGRLTVALDRYTRGILSTGQPHTPAVLARCLREAGAC